MSRLCSLTWRAGRAARLLICVLGGLASASPSAAAGSLWFQENAANDYDYGRQTVLPPGFGAGELTLELWIKPDPSYPVGPTAGGLDQRRNWASADNAPYSAADWWYAGNFLLDGHNNASFQDGTFSLQFYGGGRVRWLFGDGANAGPGGHWSVGAYPASGAPSLLDGRWHQVTLVRRWAGASGADLELWIDGALVATETSDRRTDMRGYWDSWAGFPAGQEGWFWGAEKQAAIGILSQYEDYKGLVDEVRFWSRAKSPAEIASGYGLPVTGTEPGLVGRYSFDEGMGTAACNALAPSQCIALTDMKPGYWSAEGHPPDPIFTDGFEAGEAFPAPGGS